jgi:small subunit ribosomal protein S16
VGTTKRPYYRLVVADSRSPRDGRFIETLGTYDPLAHPEKIEVNGDKVKQWMSNGARPTDAARSLLEHAGVLARGPKPVYPEKPKAETEEAPAAEEAPVADAAAQPEADAEAAPAEEAEPAPAEA